MVKNMTLPYTTVDPHSPVPLYHQIYLDLRQMIQQEILSPGAMLPPEIDICQAYNVGRQTVRQAIAHLVDEDLVERFAGRGTFVRSTHDLKQFFLDRSFSQLMREMGKEPKSKVISVELATVNTEKIPAFMKRKGADCLILERLRIGDDEPICHQISTILLDQCPGLEQEDFNQASLYEVLARRFHILINRIDHVVRAVAADDYRANLLGVPKDTPLLFVGTTAYSDNGQAIEYSTAYYRADYYEYSTTQTCCDDK